MASAVARCNRDCGPDPCTRLSPPEWQMHPLSLAYLALGGKCLISRRHRAPSAFIVESTAFITRCVHPQRTLTRVIDVVRAQDAGEDEQSAISLTTEVETEFENAVTLASPPSASTVQPPRLAPHASSCRVRRDADHLRYSPARSRPSSSCSILSTRSSSSFICSVARLLASCFNSLTSSTVSYVYSIISPRLRHYIVHTP
ncbi:hypothetical protein CC85DRAFT_137592 [Cutaneotrichosporon oleaginosum]|uniref:Uncharacterized protein n=1 Tax=Cutaneotrichosporon oleaginosum TaxID=879819 RepID=A0A0J0XWY7_9TREE|nr:uncharacterized protein CC85DRAFT_137592 [Cutaneotrichosporon oleaginosum]KLT45566.1 hypothetical protein CC85DRAFT_137592 [Cutaneotrichosporon oleaginosum]TXT14481.1 hypothetical protein COLE_00674 [Cutaneotrichosporon oleaginosum]